jgi:protein-disulfide isomerase
MMTLQTAAMEAKQSMAKKAQEEEVKQLEQALNNPLKPKIEKSRIIKGNPNAPLTIVEYSDFECPFCARGYNTVNQLFKKYPGKIKFIFKHLPLNIHPNAMISAKYFEAIALQSKKKALQFHNQIFEQQKKLKQGEKFLKKLANNLNIDMSKLAKDINSDQIEKLITSDMEEAKKYGMQGTPGFIINGIPVRGAYPAEYFDEIIKKLTAKGKLTL